jgi:thymidylate synthase (FAD)
MKIKIVAMTLPIGLDGISTPDEFIAYCARVSNPANQMNTKTAGKLIQYCAKHNHWSIFEMANVVMSVETTRDIARQILRHRSFSFQEFSQRYADPTSSLGFVKREARLQDAKNRQNSIEICDELLKEKWEHKQQAVVEIAQGIYAWAIEQGIAKEQARVVLPEGLTVSNLFMNGTLRSWIHWVKVRHHPATQKEHRELAQSASVLLAKDFPSLRGVLDDIICNNWSYDETAMVKN